MRLVATSTRDRFQVVAPTDPAVDLDALGPDARRLYARGEDVPLVADVPLRTGQTPTILEIRALGPSEAFALQPMLPEPSPALVATFRNETPLDEQPPDVQAEFFSLCRARALLFGRAGLERVVDGAPAGLPTRRTPAGGVRLWPDDIVTVLGPETMLWVGSLVERLTSPVDGQKKSGSGS